MKQLDFLIIGAMKAGTTSVHKYLSEHHSIYLPPEKEAPFFSDDDQFKKGYEYFFNDYFRNAPPDSLVGKVTPSYMMSPDAPQRIKQICPNVKIIAILRDPIERAYSHYHMAVRVKGEKRTFEEAMSEQLEMPELSRARTKGNYWSDYIVYGEYGRILEPFYRLFSSKQLLVLYIDELQSNPRVFMDKIFNFIGVKSIDSKLLGKKFHSSAKSGLVSSIAYLALQTKLRRIGKVIIPSRFRRRLRFWLGLNLRAPASSVIESGFILSPDVRNKLEELYLNDVRKLTELVGEVPYWVDAWDMQKGDGVK